MPRARLDSKFLFADEDFADVLIEIVEEAYHRHEGTGTTSADQTVSATSTVALAGHSVLLAACSPVWKVRADDATLHDCKSFQDPEGAECC
jgi:hypothetical protein